MSRFFINHPVFAWVIAILITLGGVLAILNLGVESYPNIAPTTVNVGASYPGASADLYKGTTCTIRWTSVSVPGPLCIKLRREDAPPTDPGQDIAASTANDGTHDWRVPNSVATGDYRIRVATLSGSPIIQGNSPLFTINPAVGIGTVIAARIETLTLPLTFRTSMKSKEEHWFDRKPVKNIKIVVPANEFLVGFKTWNKSQVPPASDSTLCQVYRGSPLWDAARLHTLMGKTITYAQISFRHKTTACNSLAYRVCLHSACFYSGRLGESDPPPYQTLILPIVADGGTYHIDVREMMSNWLREEAPDYHGEQHNYRIEFKGPDESMRFYNKLQCLSWFDNGVLEINYTE